MEIVYLMIGVLALIYVPIILIYRFEKHMVWQYGEPEAQPQNRDAYMNFCVAGADQADFRFLGWARDLRGGIYQVHHALLVSPDKTTIAIITAGFLGIPISGVCLYTPAADGRLFFTVNHQAFAQIDLSRNWTHQFLPEPIFGRLWQHHQAWLRKMDVSPRFFRRSGYELEDFHRVREEHCRVMAGAGLISYTDASASHWRFTLYGATRTAVRGFRIALLRRITLGRVPRTA